MFKLQLKFKIKKLDNNNISSFPQKNKYWHFFFKEKGKFTFSCIKYLG